MTEVGGFVMPMNLKPEEKKEEKKNLGRNKNKGERKEKKKKKEKRKKIIIIDVAELNYFLLFLNDHVSNFRLLCKQFLTELTPGIKLITA
jgi:hypothetical protein